MERLRRVFSRQKTNNNVQNDASSSQWRSGRQSIRSLPGGNSKKKGRRNENRVSDFDNSGVYMGEQNFWSRPAAAYHVPTKAKTTMGPRSFNGFEECANEFDRSHSLWLANRTLESPLCTRSDIDSPKYHHHQRFSSGRKHHHKPSSARECFPSDNETHRSRRTGDKEVLKTSSTSEYGSGDPSPTSQSHRPQKRHTHSSRSDYASLNDSELGNRRKSHTDHDGFKRPLPSRTSAPSRPSKLVYDWRRMNSSNALENAAFPHHSKRTDLLSDLDRPTNLGRKSPSTPRSSNGSPRKSPGSSECERLAIQSCRVEFAEEQTRRRDAERKCDELELVTKQMVHRWKQEMKALNKENDSLRDDKAKLKDLIEFKEEDILRQKQRISELELELSKCTADIRLLKNKVGLNHDYLLLNGDRHGLSHRRCIRRPEPGGIRSAGSSDSRGSSNNEATVPLESFGAGEALSSRPASVFDPVPGRHFPLPVPCNGFYYRQANNSLFRQPNFDVCFPSRFASTTTSHQSMTPLFNPPCPSRSKLDDGVDEVLVYEQRSEQTPALSTFKSTFDSSPLETPRARRSGSSISTLLEHGSPHVSVVKEVDQESSPSNKSDIMVALVGNMLRPETKNVLRPELHGICTESSPVLSADDGYSTLNDARGWRSQSAVETDLEWQRICEESEIRKFAAYRSASRMAMAIIHKNERLNLPRFSSENNLVPSVSNRVNFLRRSLSENDSADIFMAHELVFATSQSREDLFNPADFGINPTSSSDSLVEESAKAPTDFKATFDLLCNESSDNANGIDLPNSQKSTTEKATSTCIQDSNEDLGQEMKEGEYLGKANRTSRSSSYSSEETDDGKTTIETWLRQLHRKKRPRKRRPPCPKRTLVRYRPPRLSILGRVVFRRFGQRERNAIASFDFLREMPTDLSGISSSANSPDSSLSKPANRNRRQLRRLEALNMRTRNDNDRADSSLSIHRDLDHQPFSDQMLNADQSLSSGSSISFQ